jgi:hypothetical protein
MYLPAHNFNGDNLLECDQNVLRDMGIKKIGDRVRIFVAVKQLRNKSMKKRNRVWTIDLAFKETTDGFRTRLLHSTTTLILLPPLIRRVPYTPHDLKVSRAIAIGGTHDKLILHPSTASVHRAQHYRDHHQDQARL